MVTPAGKAFVDTVPFALLFGQLSPLRTGAQNPQRRFDKPATLRFLPDICGWSRRNWTIFAHWSSRSVTLDIRSLFINCQQSR
jgi:hypothetical protein